MKVQNKYLYERIHISTKKIMVQKIYILQVLIAENSRYFGILRLSDHEDPWNYNLICTRISKALHPNPHHEKKNNVKPAPNRRAYLDFKVCVVNQESFMVLLNYCVPNDQICI